jgi:hypothetical protein
MAKKDYLKRTGQIYALAIQKGYSEEELFQYTERVFAFIYMKEKRRNYVSWHNPSNLKVGDYVYVHYTEKNKQQMPQYMCYCWHRVERMSPRGIPQIHHVKFRNLHVDNIWKVHSGSMRPPKYPN